jgi:4'-phosphopantetheinyl transferase
MAHSKTNLQMLSQSFRATNEIHVWHISLNRSTDDHEMLQILAPEERARADRFHFADDRDRWLESKYAMRLILGSYLDTHPEELRFVYGSHGKPSIDPRHHSQLLHFNLAHSGDLALLAVTAASHVGIDVECRRDVIDALKIAETFFCREEIAELSSLHGSEVSDAFLRCWTRKEAYLKAHGSGLSIPLNRVRVSLGEFELARILLVDGSSQAADKWRLHHLALEPEYVGAVAVKQQASVDARLFAFSSHDFTASRQ